MAKSKKPAPAGPPRKRKYDDVRGVKHVTADQVEQLIRAASRIGRHRHRDALMILVGFRHGYRVSELVHLRRDMVNLPEQTIFVKRLKGSKSGTHDLSRREVAGFKRLFKDNDRPALVKVHGRQPWAFLNERGGPLTRSAFFKMLARAGQACEPPLSVHPHMLRHGLGYHLINEGITTRRVQDILGHRNISVTEKYTELAPAAGKPLFDD